MVVGSIAVAVPFMGADGATAVTELIIVAAIASVLGVHLVMAIGGADMPVVVSMLNSYSGWTAAAAGFMLGNDLLIITGALVGSSGFILSLIMCRAMNRSIVSVIFGGFGAEAPKPAAGGDAPVVEGEITETDADAVAGMLLAAKKVVITPGYGLAVARAQHTVQQITDFLRDKGVDVTFAIHPVAGRLPGHMNVLLAEANVPYDIVFEMDEINSEFPETDVVLVLGANDIVNPGAETDTSSPIYGMPVLKVWEAKKVVMCKRSRAVGYAGVDNPLFYREVTDMFFGDAGATMSELAGKLREQGG
ncbi:MAG: NAD(P)(+) transhydrogenase (Re/Si-specific) subunit beta, partial [Myxococcota bacterium]|nr:NAD(P)(+) transhydrogenase (Re/Si-specific) subunit beta [Myxococcota bacterium]